MRLITMIIAATMLVGCEPGPSVTGEVQESIKCGALERCNPWQVNGAGIVTHNPNANNSCDLACRASGWPSGFCPLTDLGGIEDSCTLECNSRIDKTVNPSLWQSCWANCIGSKSVECQAGDEPVLPDRVIEEHVAARSPDRSRTGS